MYMPYMHTHGSLMYNTCMCTHTCQPAGINRFSKQGIRCPNTLYTIAIRQWGMSRVWPLNSSGAASQFKADKCHSHSFQNTRALGVQDQPLIGLTGVVTLSYLTCMMVAVLWDTFSVRSRLKQQSGAHLYQDYTLRAVPLVVPLVLLEACTCRPVFLDTQ